MQDSSVQKQMFICVSYNYVTPQGSTHISSRDSIWNLLEKEIAKFSQKALVILTGDFNARTGSMPDYILHDSRECAHLPPDYIPDYPLARYSEDNVLNGYGRKLLNLCKGSKLSMEELALKKELENTHVLQKEETVS